MRRAKQWTAPVLLALAVAALAGCTQKIPGHPEKTVSEYVEAVRGGDFKTVFRLNFTTAKNTKYLKLSEVGDPEQAIQEAHDRAFAQYQAAAPTFMAGVLWSEKGYFIPDSQVEIGSAFSQPPAPDDPVNAEYEAATSVYVPVTVTYSNPDTAPALNNRKIRVARYDCSLRKIREGKNVRVYSHDDRWFFAGCVIETGSIEHF